jgi:hypothetical protein
MFSSTLRLGRKAVVFGLMVVAAASIIVPAASTSTASAEDRNWLSLQRGKANIHARSATRRLTGQPTSRRRSIPATSDQQQGQLLLAVERARPGDGTYLNCGSPRRRTAMAT